MLTPIRCEPPTHDRLSHMGSPGVADCMSESGDQVGFVISDTSLVGDVHLSI